MYNQEFQRPREVGIAVKLLWGATAILWVWTLRSLIEMYHSNIFDYRVVIMSGLNSVFYIILISLFVLMISKGRNWARVVLLAICILGLLSTDTVTVSRSGRSVLTFTDADLRCVIRMAA
jgi:hypothetical protein